MTEQPVPFKPWTPRDIETAARIWQRDYTDHYGDDEAPRGTVARVMNLIGNLIGASYERVHQRWQTHGPSFNAGGRSRDVTGQALADRDARKLAADLRSEATHPFGDPPPGYSALDRRARR